jgi:hypothetical protein
MLGWLAERSAPLRDPRSARQASNDDNEPNRPNVG